MEVGKDHRVSLFERVSRSLGGRLVILPPGGRITFAHKAPKLKAA